MGEVALSIIVPVLNEAALLESFLHHLRERGPDAQILVVDGGSTDGGREIASDLAERLNLWVVECPRGRARQMNAGAALASGEVLWFLHADSRLPVGAVPALLDAMGDERLAGGCFRLRIPHPAPIYRVSDWLGNVGVEIFRIALGDHGIFCRRTAFEGVGGYPNVTLLEDAELYRGLRRIGWVRQLAPAIETSPRRYEKRGRVRTTLEYGLILGLYVVGVRPRALERVFRAVR